MIKYQRKRGENDDTFPICSVFRVAYNIEARLGLSSVSILYFPSTQHKEEKNQERKEIMIWGSYNTTPVMDIVYGNLLNDPKYFSRFRDRKWKDIDPKMTFYFIEKKTFKKIQLFLIPLADCAQDRFWNLVFYIV